MLRITLILTALFVSISSFAQLPGADTLNEEENALLKNVTQVSDNIYMLQGRGGNIGVYVGEDGVYMIDDQFAEASATILKTISLISDKPLKLVINTHHHGDHTGGNENMKNAGAIIIAHEKATQRMNLSTIEDARKKYSEDLEKAVSKVDRDVRTTEESTKKDTRSEKEITEQQQMQQKLRYEEAAKNMAPISDYIVYSKNTPNISFKGDVDMHFNEDFKLIHIKNAHTDGDIIVHFPASNVIHTGDIFFNGKYPNIDSKNGGSVQGALNGLKKIQSYSNDTTKIIPGHGPLGSLDDVKVSIAMMSYLIERVKYLAVSGKTKAQIIANRDITKKYDDLGYGEGYIPTEKFLEFIYDEVAKGM